MWYALVQDEQLGPMSMQELGELFTQGVVTVDTFIWREGMAEWLPLTRVDEFLEITNAVVMDLADHGGPIAEPGLEDDEDDDAATMMIGAGEGGQWAGYLDELAANAPNMASEPVESPAPAPQPQAQPQPQRQAQPRPAPEPAISPLDAPPAPVHTPPPAHFEPPELPAPPEFAQEFSAPAFPAPQAAAPAAAPEGGKGKLVGIVVGLLVVAGLAVGAVIMFGGDGGDGGEGTPGTTPGTQAATAGTQAPATQAPATQAPATQAPPPDAAVPLDAGVPDAEVDAMVLEFIDVRPDEGVPDAAPPPKRQLTPEEIAARKKAREERMKRYLEAKKAAEARKKAAAAAAADKGKPKQLSRDDIQGVIRANTAKFDACAKKDEKAKGTVVIAMRIQRDGSVPFAKVATARLRGSAAGKCLESAMKGLKFKAFAGDPMRINLPLKL